MQKIVLLGMLLQVLMSLPTAQADVLPDKKEGAAHFIRITKSVEAGKRFYAFALCLQLEVNVCEQIGLQAKYSAVELKAKEQALKDRGMLATLGGLLSGGLSLLGTAHYYFVRQTIAVKNLEKTVKLKYEVNDEGVETGSLYDYAKKLEKALKVTATVDKP